MSADWPVLTLGDVCQKITDGAHNSPKSVTVGKPMASVKDLTRFGVDLSEARLIPQEDFDKLVKQGCQPEVGDVLIAKDGNSALDTVCTVDKPLDAVMLSSVAILRPDKEKLDSDFLKYYFSSKQIIDYLKNNFISGAAIPRVVLKDFRKAEIKVPPIVKQKEISKVLRSLDDKIELNRQTNQILEQIAQAIFKSWFVDFDPVKAKVIVKEKGGNELAQSLAAQAIICGAMTLEQLQELENEYQGLEDKIHPLITEKFPNEMGLDYWSPETLQKVADLFPNTLIDSELGEIPKGWEIKTIDDVTSLIIDHRGKTPKKLGGDWSNSGHPALSAKNIKKGRIVRHENIRFLDDEIYSKWMKEELEVGDILLTSEAPMGEMFFLTNDTKYCLSQRLYALRADDKNVTPSYLYQWLHTPIAQADLEGRATGTTVVGIRQVELRKVNVLTPNSKILKMFEKITYSLLCKLYGNEEENLVLEQLRDALLPKLFSGELSVELTQTQLEKAI